MAADEGRAFVPRSFLIKNQMSFRIKRHDKLPRVELLQEGTKSAEIVDDGLASASNDISRNAIVHPPGDPHRFELGKAVRRRELLQRIISLECQHLEFAEVTDLSGPGTGAT